MQGRMGKSSKNCKVASHQILKDQAKYRVESLQSMLNQLQSARKESGPSKVADLEEEVNRVLCEWKAELDEPTPNSSLREDSLGSFAEELGLLLGQFDVSDDATSLFREPSTMNNEPKLSHEHIDCLGHGNGEVSNRLTVGNTEADKEVYHLNHEPHQHEFRGVESAVAYHGPYLHELQGFPNHSSQLHDCHGFEHFNGTSTSQGTVFSDLEASQLNNVAADNLDMSSPLDYPLMGIHQNFDNEVFTSVGGMEQWGFDDISNLSAVVPNVNIPPSAYLGPKCALWDCARPAQGFELCNNYCCSFHAELAVKECAPGTATVLRPGGIGLKDGPLMLALRSKIEGKDVGIPECHGAATSKSPWNAPELFDIQLLEGEKIREWLFFDKPRRAFESGNRKQRSLPDHAGRGWHESRKIEMNEFGGRKRSYYADPQPQKKLEWHLYEYKIDNCDVYALYRLELKVAEEKKKSPKTKAKNDPLVDLQKRMDRLSAEVVTDDKLLGKAKGNDQSDGGNNLLVSSS